MDPSDTQMSLLSSGLSRRGNLFDMPFTCIKSLLKGFKKSDIVKGLLPSVNVFDELHASGSYSTYF